MRSLLATAALTLLAAACGSLDSAEGTGDYGGSGGDEVPTTTGGGGNPNVPRSPDDAMAAAQDTDTGFLAGDWDDNKNFDWFLDQVGGGALLTVTDRVLFQVQLPEGAPVGGAWVTVTDQDTPTQIWSAVTPADGRVMMLPKEDMIGTNLVVEVTAPGGMPVTQNLELDGNPRSVTLEVPTAAPVALPTAIQVALVVDATGSMTDEIDYLARNLEAMMADVQTLGAIDVDMALIAYRDSDAPELMQQELEILDFGSEMNSVANVRQALGSLVAVGGGDYPEKLDLGLGAIKQLSWDPEVPRVVFVVGDAPPHPDDEEAALRSVDDARRDGIRIYPVAATGSGLAAEMFLRQVGQVALGRYIFHQATDGQGAGDFAHPRIPCYEILTLHQQMVRAIHAEILGKREEIPSISDVGYPVNGMCQIGTRTAYL